MALVATIVMEPPLLGTHTGYVGYPHWIPTQNVAWFYHMCKQYKVYTRYNLNISLYKTARKQQHLCHLEMTVYLCCIRTARHIFKILSIPIVLCSGAWEPWRQSRRSSHKILPNGAKIGLGSHKFSEVID